MNKVLQMWSLNLNPSYHVAARSPRRSRGVDLWVRVNNILNYKSVACDNLPLSSLNEHF